jgi:hypothetical protein
LFYLWTHATHRIEILLVDEGADPRIGRRAPVHHALVVPHNTGLRLPRQTGRSIRREQLHGDRTIPDPGFSFRDDPQRPGSDRMAIGGPAAVPLLLDLADRAKGSLQLPIQPVSFEGVLDGLERLDLLPRRFILFDQRLQETAWHGRPEPGGATKCEKQNENRRRPKTKTACPPGKSLRILCTFRFQFRDYPTSRWYWHLYRQCPRRRSETTATGGVGFSPGFPRHGDAPRRRA